MNCSTFLATLHDYFMGRLGAQTMAQADAHSAACPECGALMERARELSCRDFVAFLDAYVEDALAPDERARFERHIEICDDCKNYLQSYRKTIELAPLAFGEDEALPEGIPDELLAAILRARKQG